jgi:hypothetical protein
MISMIKIAAKITILITGYAYGKDKMSVQIETKKHQYC